jgi:hypothetical protein
LVVLDLHNNLLTGKLPSLLERIPANLQMIMLQQNNFTGPIPSSWATIQSLRHLDLASNQLTGNIPNELKLLSNSMYAFLPENDFFDRSYTDLPWQYDNSYRTWFKDNQPKWNHFRIPRGINKA